MQKVVTQQFAAVSTILWPGMDLGIFFAFGSSTGSPLMQHTSEAQMLHQFQRAFLPTQTGMKSPKPSLMNFLFVRVEISDWKSSVCLQDFLPPSPPCNTYVKLDCAAGGSRVPWDHLKLIILSEGGSPWEKKKKKKVSLRQLQSLGGYWDFAFRVVSSGRVFNALGTG